MIAPGASLAALAAGALLACAFAPLQCWPLAILCPAVLMWLWEDSTARRGAWLGFCFGAGTFGLGTWWLLISIYGFGGAPIWLAVLLLLALVAIMAAYHALLGYLACRYLPAGPMRWLLGLPGLWLLMEWWRGWFLTGFPWLSLGYSQTDTVLRAFGPVIGVYGISALLLLGSGSLLALLRGTHRIRLLGAALLLLPWAGALALERISWTGAVGSAVSVAIVQGAVPQDLKWQADNEVPTRDLYARLTRQQALGAQLIVWPEAALPQLANEVPRFLGQMYSDARARGSDLIMGILRVDPQDRYYNSIMTLGDHVSFYDKHHLVPFAEYFPVPPFVRSWLRLMNLPYSDFTPGAAHQDPVDAGGTTLAESICYEDAYGSANLASLARAGLLVNVTNDAWFGHSWARYQHFQIARMRAIEAQRPLLRAANDGVSALVGEQGQVLARAQEFQPLVLRGTVQPRRGLPPYAWIGNLPVVAVSLVAAALAIWRRRPKTAPKTTDG